MRETQNIGSGVGGRNAVDFTSGVRGESINAVNSGLVKDSAANALEAAESNLVETSSSAAKAVKAPSLAGRVGRVGGIALRRAQELGDAATGEGSEAGQNAAGDSADMVMDIARRRRNAALRAEAENAIDDTGIEADAVDGLDGSVKATGEAGKPTAAKGTSARSSMLNSVAETNEGVLATQASKPTGATANAATGGNLSKSGIVADPTKGLAGSVAKASETAKGAAAATESESAAGAAAKGSSSGVGAAASAIKNPLKAVTGTSEMSAAALSKTKTALLAGKGAAGAAGAASAISEEEGDKAKAAAESIDENTLKQIGED